MAFNNRNNLNPQSAPWGREVEQKVEDTERGLSSLRALTENNNKATNATLGAISRQQDSIIATQDGLRAAQGALEDQQTQLQAQQDQLRNGVDVEGWAHSVWDSISPDSFQLTKTMPVPEWATSLYVTAYASVEGPVSSGTSGSVLGELYVGLAREADPMSTFLEVSASGVQPPGSTYFIGGHNQRVAKIDVMEMTTLHINISGFVSLIPSSWGVVSFYVGVTAFWRAD